MHCKNCLHPCIKKGTRNKRQRWFCKPCKKYQQEIYVYKKYCVQDSEMLLKLTKEGLGTSSIARIMHYSKATIQRQVEKLAATIQQKAFSEQQQCYEVDELHTYTKKKQNECWIIYALNKATGSVIDFIVGKRTRENVKKVIDTLMKLSPKNIFTDLLNIYPKLICPAIHVAAKHKTNHIERRNLELRKNVKCLNRRTICYSKSERLLTAKLKLIFFKLSNQTNEKP